MTPRGVPFGLGTRQRDGGCLFATEDALKRVQPGVRVGIKDCLGMGTSNLSGNEEIN
jgi:hypothetical protein